MVDICSDVLHSVRMSPQSRPRIGRKIRRAMERKRLDQADVADALGVSRSAVNAWINDRAWPANSVGALEDLLDISIDEPESSETAEEALDRLQRELDQLKQALREQGKDSNGEKSSARRAV